MKILSNILRFIFGWIDAIIAKVITLVYDLLLNLANLSLYSDNIVKVVGQRIGIILGIFMLFRLAISLINYMISPEKFSDNKQGGAQLIQNIAISLILLATVNTIFRTAYDVQQKIVSSQIIEKVFFGTTVPKYSNGTKEEKNIDIGYYLFTSFFVPNKNVIPSCTLEYGDDLWDTSFDLANSECDDELYEVLETNARKSLFDAKNNLDMSKVLSNTDLVNATKGGTLSGVYVFEYTPIISTAAGVIALLLLVSFSMDLATRAVKLLFLQLVAPIPIIFNMDTGKGKDVFQKWYKECFNTYISVFIRLIAIDFAVFIIVLIKGNFKSIFQQSFLLNVFIIIGCLMFAKQVPKLIENIMGIKLDGMSLRPLKKFEENALFAKQIEGIGRGALAGVIGIGAGATGAYVASRQLGDNRFTAFLKGTRGTVRGVAGGFTTGYKDKNAFSAIKTGFGRARTNAEYVNKLDGSSIFGRARTGVQQFIGAQTRADNIEKENKELENIAKLSDEAMKRAESEIIKHNDDLKINWNGTNISMTDFKADQQKLELLKNTEIKESDYANRTAYEQAQSNMAKQIAALQDDLAKKQKEFAIQYINEVDAGNANFADGTMSAIIKEMQHSADKLIESNGVENRALFDGVHGTYVDSTGKTITIGQSIKASKDNANVRRRNVENSKFYRREKANRDATKPSGR